MIIDQILDVKHQLCVASSCDVFHIGDIVVICKYGRRLRMQDEGYGQKTLERSLELVDGLMADL